MTDESSANKFIKCVLKFDPTMVFKATTVEGQTFKSKGYNEANKKFEATMSKRLKEQLKSEGTK